MISIKNPMFK